jgi:hypothetical protein
LFWNEIVSLIELDPYPSNPPYPLYERGSRYGRNDIRFGIIFGCELFEPAIFKRSKNFHWDDFLWFNEEIVTVGFSCDSLMICPVTDRFISDDTIVSIATISCYSIYLE